MGTDILLYIITQCLVIVYGQSKSQLSTDKPLLRYGFQKTKECNDFQRAFLCVRKCLDLFFDIAHADKNCVCTCYHSKNKAKYSSVILGQSTKWRLGAPTTSQPAWAQPNKAKFSGQGYSDDSHEFGDIADQHGYVGQATLVQLGKPTDIVFGPDGMPADGAAGGVAGGAVGGTPPTNANATPADGGAASPVGGAAPADGSVAHADGGAAPADGGVSPADGGTAPADGGAIHAVDEKTFAEAGLSPADGGATPAANGDPAVTDPGPAE